MRNKGRTFAFTLGLAVCVIAGVLAVGGTAYSLSSYLVTFDNTYSTTGTVLDTCGVCHIDPAGGGPKNSYGTDFANASIGDHTFNATLEGTDSDGDTFSNIDEIISLTFPGDNTSFPPDNTAPTVLSTVPADNAVNQPINVVVTATFSEAIDNTTVDNTSFILTDALDNVVDGTVAVSADNTMATFTSSAFLDNTAQYKATLTTAVKDLAGNPLADNVVWSFTTGTGTDVIPPEVLSTDPADGATGVAVTTTISATFSEPIDPATVDGIVTAGVDNVDGTIIVTDNTITFTPSASLSAGKTYTVTITSAADFAGNPLAADVTWSFTTRAASSSSSSGGCSVGGSGGNGADLPVILVLTLLAILVTFRRRMGKTGR